MGTVPTGQLERELRKLYLQWVSGLSRNADNLPGYIDQFRAESTRLINRLGGNIARLGVATANFPAPKELDLSPVLNKVYDQMQQAAISAGIATGLNARDIASSMFRAGLNSSYNNLERLARTEVVSAYWQNQWNSVEGLGLVLVWGAENGPRTCPYCLAKDGLVVSDKFVRDHPNGRCTLIPTLPSRVGLRDKSRNPNFLRQSWDGTVPRQLDQALGRGLDHALVANLPAQQAITGMVSQGWTSSQAARYMLSRPGMAVSDLTREDWSRILRSLESYAQELWDGLSRDVAPGVLYRAGSPALNTGLVSWTSSLRIAELYSVRNGGAIYEMTVPKGIYAYEVKSNPVQKEFLVLGSPRATGTDVSRGGRTPTITGSLDGPTMMIQAPV